MLVLSTCSVDLILALLSLDHLTRWVRIGGYGRGLLLVVSHFYRIYLS